MIEPDPLIMRATVHISGIEPPITRTLELPMDLNLAQLHGVLQATFGWSDSHLHQFNIGGLTYGAPEFDEDGLTAHRIFEASDVRLADFVVPYNAPIIITYEYDFGDCWSHVIEMTRRPREADVRYPRCVAGSRAGPPEDVGGSPGYADFLEAWRDPAHEQHHDMRRWVGKKFDPERFDLVEKTKRSRARSEALGSAIATGSEIDRRRHGSVGTFEFSGTKPSGEVPPLLIPVDRLGVSQHRSFSHRGHETRDWPASSS
jgi:hypothetical protein